MAEKLFHLKIDGAEARTGGFITGSPLFTEGQVRERLFGRFTEREICDGSANYELHEVTLERRFFRPTAGLFISPV